MQFDYESKIRNLNGEFLNNPYFSAYSIMTPKKDWLTVHRFDNSPSNIASKAISRGLTNVVVCEDGDIKGFINAKDLKEGRWNTMKEGIENYMLKGGMLLPDLVDRMVMGSRNMERDQSPLYFVTQKENSVEDIVGILTFWDLNRAPSYVFFYSILVAIEQTLLLTIRKSHTEWCDHTETLGKIEDELRNTRSFPPIFQFAQGPEYNFKKLDKWDLRALKAFYERDLHIREQDESFQQLIDILTSNLRNRVGHPVKFIIKDDRHFKDDLKTLSKILHYGKEFFVGFPNPKVRHESQP